MVDRIKEVFRVDCSNLDDLRAECAAIFDIDDDKYLFKKNILKSYSIGSNVRMVAALFILENTDLNDEIEIPADFAKMYKLFAEGDKFTIKQCLFAMLSIHYKMADLLATHVAGDMPTFIQKLNDFAKQIGMKHSEFVDAYGTSFESYTCASDMVKFCKYAAKNKAFMDIIGQERCVFDSAVKKYQMMTTNATIIASSKFYIKDSIGGDGHPFTRINGLYREWNHPFVNFFNYAEHVYVTVQGGIYWKNPKFDEGLFNGVNIKYEDALRMYNYIANNKTDDEKIESDANHFSFDGNKFRAL